MGKSKGRSRHVDNKEFTERDSIQNYKSVIRKLKKENEHLRRELRKRGDVSQDYQELLQEFDGDLNPTRKNACPQCKEGDLMKIDFGVKTVMTCNSCKYRKTQKRTE